MRRQKQKKMECAMVEKNAVFQRLGFKGNETDGMIDFRLKAVI